MCDSGYSPGPTYVPGVDDPSGPSALSDAVEPDYWDVVDQFVLEQIRYETDPEWGLTSNRPNLYNGIPLQKFLPGFKEKVE